MRALSGPRRIIFVPITSGRRAGRLGAMPLEVDKPSRYIGRPQVPLFGGFVGLSQHTSAVFSQVGPR